MFRIRSLVVVGIALSLAACSKEPSKLPTDPVNQVITTAHFDSSLHVDVGKSTATPSGLYYRDIVEGQGPVAAAGMTVAVNYTGWLVDGKEFDSSAGKAPISLVLGAHRVIPGWEEGLTGMHVGGKRQLIIPASLGYGAMGMGPIPPNAVLVFSVELMSAQ